MKDAYTAKEIGEAKGLVERAIRKRAAAESWPFVQRPGRGGGKLFPLVALPADVREALAAGAAGHAAAGRVEGRKAVLGETMAEAAKASARQDGLTRYQRLSPEGKLRADARAALVRACRHYAATAGLSATAGRKAFSSGYNASRIEVDSWIRDALPSVSAGSLRNWDETLDKEGLAALAGEYGQHRKGSGTIDSNTDLRDLILGMLVEYPHSSSKHVMRAIKARIAKSQHPSKRALQRWIATWKADNEQLHMAVTNPDKWRNQYQAAAGDADENITRLNQVWEYDSTPGDVLLSDGARHAVIGVIDIYSRRLKLHVARSSCAAGICSLTRRAIMDWGLLETAKTDNGADYVSKQMVRVFAGLGVQHHIAPPFSPDRKPFIERVFCTFSHDMLELLEGFIGHNVAERKDIEARRSFADRLMKKGETVELPRLSPEDFQAFCDWWTDDVYAHDEHSGLGGKSPWQMAAEWAEPIRAISDERALDVLLLPVAGKDGWRMVKKKGISTDNGLFNHALLGGLEGSNVLVLADEHDAGTVHVFNEAGEYVCQAIDPLRKGISQIELAAARRAHQKRVLAEEKKALRAASKRANIKDIVRDIREQTALESGRLARLPHVAQAYTTDALDQAGIAARAGDAPPAVSEANAAARKALATLDAKPASVHQLPEHPRQRYRKWQELDARIAGGEDVSEQDRRWHGSYQKHPEFLSWRAVMGGAAAAAGAK